VTRRARWLGGGLVIAGVVLRAEMLSRRGSLWLDEAMLALNVLSRGFPGLLNRLDYDQAAPFPFLWGVKAVAWIGGVGDTSLRALPFLAGCLLVLAVWRLAGRLLSERAALLTVVGTAFAPLLVRYSTELKQYSSDALLSVIVLLVAVRTLDEGGGRAAPLLATGCLALLGSHTAVFVLGGVLAALAVHGVRPGPCRRTFVLCGAAWAVSGAIVYVLFLRDVAGHEYFQRFFESRMLSLRSAELAERARSAIKMLLSQIFPLRPRALTPAVAIGIGLAALIGTASVWRRWSPSRALLLACPLLLVLGASMLGRYPVEPRLLLFVMPPFLILVSAGLVAAVEAVVREPLQPAALAIVAALHVHASVTGLVGATGFYFESDAGPVLREYLAAARPDAPAYVFGRGVPEWVLYTTDWKRPDRARLRWFAEVASSGGPGFFNAPRRRGRVDEAEAARVTFTGTSAVELVGLPTGIERRADGGIGGVGDLGWVDVELARISGTGSSEVWLFFSRLVEEGRLRQGLLDGLADRGWELLDQASGRNAILYRFRLESPGAAAAALVGGGAPPPAPPGDAVGSSVAATPEGPRAAAPEVEEPR